jgi:hypothetical protein
MTIGPRPCPTCRRPAAFDKNPYRPFCSERCKLIDLGKWASGTYRVPGETASTSGLERTEGYDSTDDTIQ